MHILITGAGGQLGSEWVHFLQQSEADQYTACSSADLDITNSDQLSRVISDTNPDVIINCAAYTKVDQAEDEPDKAFAVNAEAVKKMAAICAQKNKLMVHYSTDYVFQGTENEAKTYPDGYPEAYPTNPLNTYGKSKEAGEKALIDSGCEFLLFRVAWLCGKYGHNFVKTMLRLAGEKKELQIVNDQWGSPTFTKDIVRNSYHLISCKKRGLYHFSSAGRTNWADFAREIFSQRRLNVKVKGIPGKSYETKAQRPAFSLLSTDKIANIPGVTIKDWKHGLSELLNELNT